MFTLNRQKLLVTWPPSLVRDRLHVFAWRTGVNSAAPWLYVCRCRHRCDWKPLQVRSDPAVCVFIFSYLTGDQFSSESSLEAYSRCLRLGCRCIERETPARAPALFVNSVTAQGRPSPFCVMLSLSSKAFAREHTCTQ